MAKCGNCRGSGKLRMLMKNKKYRDFKCPTCQGTGKLPDDDPRRLFPLS